MIISISGEPGTGKTYQAMGFPEPVTVLDTENRDQPTADRFYRDRLVEVIPIKAFTAGFRDDYLKSYHNLVERTAEWMASPEPPTLVLDSVSDIRNKYAVAKWHRDHPQRKRPALYEYREINDTVRDVLFPLINRARVDGVHLVFTVQMGPEYGAVCEERDGKMIRVTAKVGRKPVIEEWIEYQVDTLVTLSTFRSKGRWVYRAEVTKSPAGCFSLDLGPEPGSLYLALLETGL
jgi:hypothetical protein